MSYEPTPIFLEGEEGRAGSHLAQRGWVGLVHAAGDEFDARAEEGELFGDAGLVHGEESARADVVALHVELLERRERAYHRCDQNRFGIFPLNFESVS